MNTVDPLLALIAQLQGNQTEVAKQLTMSRATLNRFINLDWTLWRCTHRLHIEHREKAWHSAGTRKTVSDGASTRKKGRRTMPTTFVESGEQKLLARVLKQRASGSLMEEHNEVESQRRKLGDKMTLINHAESIIGERVSDNPSVPKFREAGNRTRIKEWQGSASTHRPNLAQYGPLRH